MPLSQSPLTMKPDSIQFKGGQPPENQKQQEKSCCWFLIANIRNEKEQNKRLNKVRQNRL